jgi:hypothetical protein
VAKIDVKQMLESMRARLERDQADGKLAGLSVDELAEAVSHPKAAEMIAELMEAEAASVQEGDPAPDFTLPWLPESGEGLGPEMALSDHFGKRSVALIFGSYT